MNQEYRFSEYSGKVNGVSFMNVNINHGFFRNYIKQMVCKVVPTAIQNVSNGTGGMPNIINAAKKHRGEEYAPFSGMFFVDSDVHKVLESMCYAIAIDPMGDEEIILAQNRIKEKLEEWIPYYVDAQDESGYFDTYYILDENRIKWSDVDKHELYCMGHFIEAAIAHYQCTGGDMRLIDAAVRIVDYLGRNFGFGNKLKKQICGHQEIEIALLKLADTLTLMGGEYRKRAGTCRRLASFFLEVRGDYEERTVECGRYEYWQDHKKTEYQTEAVGHGVRAQYMYTAMTELASKDEGYRRKYNNALSSLWRDVTFTKQYVTGGIGQSSANEGFAESYKLPNASGYCETCAGIANMLWNRSMSKLYKGSEFADKIETVLYNAVLGSVNLDGDRFYYCNPLRSDGKMRNKWYGTACCPPNLTRTILSLGGYIYNHSNGEIYINQYITNEAVLYGDGGETRIRIKSALPWSGEVNVHIVGADDGTVLYMRKPYWADHVSLKTDGRDREPVINENGYIEIKLSGDSKIDICFSMPVMFEESVPEVKENRGYTSIRRGPLVYCAEEADNGFNVFHSFVDKSSDIKLEWTDNFDGKSDPYGVRGMNLIKLGGKRVTYRSAEDVEMTFIPFFARLNRTAGKMSVYVSKNIPVLRPVDFAAPSASYTFPGDSVYNLNDGSDDVDMRWTNWKSGTVLTDTWVQYDFEEELSLKGCRIWWYDDNGGVRLARSFEIYYKNSETAEFVPVEHGEEYLCDHAEGFISYAFKEVSVRSLRLVIYNEQAAAGIVEWDVIEGDLNKMG